MLKLNWKQGGQPRPYSSFNIALGPHWAVGQAFWDPKVSSNKSQADFYVKVELEAWWPVESLFQL